ncbi:hypothetical protein HFN49_00015 [Rhizobium leguminosarum]|uniref:trypsin-like serine peptidase n=1 Tax=Rhizobium ruizarguesonis TaxID=2081791 RepID=UPI001A980D10|nr:hypothetical protein [Rhizobium ruizarguesonis]MBY5884585.1 hypothetical protein [Rhizobium leguminosarum]QSZ05150.1 hypothetical protein J3P73_31575 [Rhizobium ruizarguesonis]
MRHFALVVALILLSTAADAQEGSTGAPSGFSTPGPSVSFAPGSIGSYSASSGSSSAWGYSGSTALPLYSNGAVGTIGRAAASSPSVLNQIPIRSIADVDLINIPPGTPGYNLDFKDVLGTSVGIGNRGSNWPGIPIGSTPDFPYFDPSDAVKQIVGPEGASGALRGLYDLVKFPAEAAPPAVRFLRTDTTQDAYSHSCQTAVDGLLPFRDGYYWPCHFSADAKYGQCHAALHAYVEHCLAFATVSTSSSYAQPSDAAPKLAPAVLSKITAVSGILFHEASNPADSRVYCTAVRVAKAWLMTARHCGFQQKQGTWVTLDPAEIRFVPFDNPTQLLKIGQPKDPHLVPGPLIYNENDTSNDYMFFHIDGETPDRSVPAIAAPKTGDRLVLFSFSVTALMDSNQYPQVTDDRLVRGGTWTNFMAYDASRTCIVGAMPPPNCLAYPCQAEFASSGGPLFRISGDDVALVGVHVGHIDPGSSDNCANPQLLGLVNRGVAPLSTDLAILN